MSVNIYVGCWWKSPTKADVPHAGIHPSQFAEFYQSMRADGFTNNPDFLDHVSPDNVIVVLNDGTCVPLLQMLELKDIEGSYLSGELWSFTDAKRQT
jgi:hypothetical protein